MAEQPLMIRSYRGVFRFERRLYRIDRWRLPLRQGLPVRALLYAPVAYAALLCAGALPLLGPVLGVLPAPVRWLLLPGALVVAALRVQVAGRPGHRALVSILRWAVSPRWLAGLRRCPPPAGRLTLTGALVVRPDTRGPHYRPGRVAGPAHVVLSAPAQLAVRSELRRVELTPLEDAHLTAGRLLELPANSELVIR